LGSGAPGNLPVVPDIPLVLRTSTAFWLASAATGILPVVLEVARIDYGQSTPQWAVPFLVVTAVPWAALQVWAALELLRGARWARAVLTVLAALSALAAYLDLSGLILAGLALTAAGAVLMWRPASTLFLRQA
jgi:hypothetical protein